MKITQKAIKDFSKSKYLELLPKFKEKKTQKITTLLLTFAAFSLFGFFAISPTVATIAQLKKELEDNRYVNSKLEEKIKNLALLQQKYSLLKDDFENVFSAVPENSKVYNFAGQIQAIAQDTNVRLSRLQIYEIELTKFLLPPTLAVDDPTNYNFFAFSFGASGSYSDILNFLTSVSNFDRIVTFDNVSANKGDGDIYQISIRGKTYFKK